MVCIYHLLITTLKSMPPIEKTYQIIICKKTKYLKEDKNEIVNKYIPQLISWIKELWSHLSPLTFIKSTQRILIHEHFIRNKRKLFCIDKTVPWGITMFQQFFENKTAKFSFIIFKPDISNIHFIYTTFDIALKIYSPQT